MKITKEVNTAADFEFWAGAAATVEYLTDDEIELIFSTIEDCCPDGLTETEVNDFFWFECDTIAEWLGYDDFEQIMKRQSGIFEN